MKINCRLSIIIPLYNMGCFIETCLTSLFDQDIPNNEYEILVVNDGSSDNGPDIVAELQQAHKNLVLINRENAGVSSARNVGLQIANGDYVIFIDADDHIEKNTLKRSLELINAQSLDLLVLNYVVCDSNRQVISKNSYSKLKNKVFTGIEAYKFTRRRTENIPDRCWAILYRLNFLRLNNLIFQEGMHYLEDGLFVGIVLSRAQRCAFDDEVFYYRIENPESASNSNLYFTKKARVGFIEASLFLKRYKEKFRQNEIQQELLNHLIAKFVIISLISAIGSASIKEIVLVIKQLHELGFNKLETKGLIGNKAYAKTYNFSKALFIIYYLVESRIKTTSNLLKKAIK